MIALRSPVEFASGSHDFGAGRSSVVCYPSREGVDCEWMRETVGHAATNGFVCGHHNYH